MKVSIIRETDGLEITLACRLLPGAEVPSHSVFECHARDSDTENEVCLLALEEIQSSLPEMLALVESRLRIKILERMLRYQVDSIESFERSCRGD